MRFCWYFLSLCDSSAHERVINLQSVRTCFTNCYLEHFLWNCSWMSAIDRIYANHKSVPVMVWCRHTKKPLQKPMLTQIFFAICHHSDVIMGTIASEITSLTIVYSTVYSDADQRKHQSSASLAFVRGIHRGPVNSPHKWPVTRKMFPFDDVIMTQSQWLHGFGCVIKGTFLHQLYESRSIFTILPNVLPC